MTRHSSEAASYAIDYNQLATTINGEYGKVPGKGVIPPSCKGYDESLGSLEFDADKAAEMLDEAGYEGCRRRWLS
ncbi:MAG: ABC transporter substrate-binding protein [Blautia sp.]